MTTRSGLDAQIGVKTEATPGAGGSPDHFFPFTEENLKLEAPVKTVDTLQSGVKFQRLSQVYVPRRSVSGGFQLPVAFKGQGILWRHLIGSNAAPVQIGAGPAYKQVHTPGDMVGKSMAIQVGRPEPGTGTVVPFTYSGVKVTGFDLTVSSEDPLSLNVKVDGWDETTATPLAAASYPTGNQVFTFQNWTTFKLGGTATTASGETTITGGVAVQAIVEEFKFSVEWKYADDRYGGGNAGIKREQLENGIPEITGSATAEFANTELYQPFLTQTTKAMQVDFEGPEITAGVKYLFSLILPAVRITEAPPAVGGPGLVKTKLEFRAFSDEVNPILQVKLVNTDTTL